MFISYPLDTIINVIVTFYFDVFKSLGSESSIVNAE
jgi:hypothetical protein